MPSDRDEPPPADPMSPADFGLALAPVFEADLPAALRRLSALPESALDEKQRSVRERVLRRFAGGDPGPDTERGLEGLPQRVAAIVRAYRHYWSTALMRRLTTEQAESQLSAMLAGALAGVQAPSISPPTQDLDALADAAKALLESHTLYVLGGVTAPLRELMVWRAQQSALQTIALPGGTVDVKVTLIDDFISVGWAAWATCDHRHTGGWAVADGIMVVRTAWQLDSEDYRISLLAHEAQHFSDYQRYPKLAPAELEYRAKLVELALSDDTQQRLWAKFVAEARCDRGLPHAYASYWLVEHLKQRLGGDAKRADAAPALRTAALAALAAHSAALDAAIDAAGINLVQTALP